MPYMQTTRTLRATANGAPTTFVANVGDQVNILEESQGWAHIQLVGKVGTGWVLSNTIGGQNPVPPGDAIDQTAFFLTCWRIGLSAQVLPHYLAGIAYLRSNISNAQVGTDYGPFRFTQAQWDAARSTPEFGYTDLTASDIGAWDLQCALFAAMAQRDQAALASAIGGSPSAAELYLAQLIGPKAAASALNNPNNTIEAALNSVPDADLPIGGLTRAQIMDRYATYLRVGAAGTGSQQSKQASGKIAADLQTALNAVQDGVVAAGTTLLGNQPSPDTIITDPTQRPSPNAPSPSPSSGGVLGALVAAHESGAAGYNAYNRGNAGDSPNASMNFAAMSLAQITQLQALPTGNPNRLFAVGKYQIIPTTMKDAIAKLGLALNQMLTPDLQETLFRSYLVAIKRPQVKSFITGGGASLTDAELALAQEFASFPNPATGLSCYGGSGGNRATVTTAQSAAALTTEQTNYNAKITRGTPADQAWIGLSA